MAETITTVREDLDNRFAWDTKTTITDLDGNVLERTTIFDDGREKQVVFEFGTTAQISWSDPLDAAFWSTRSETRRVDLETGALGRLVSSEVTNDGGRTTTTIYQVVNGENIPWEVQTSRSIDGYFSNTHTQFSALPGFRRVESSFGTPEGSREAIHTTTPFGTVIQAQDHWEDRALWDQRIEYKDKDGDTLSVGKTLDTGGEQHETYVDGEIRAAHIWTDDTRTLRIYDANGDLYRTVAFDASGRVMQSGPRGPQEDFDDLSTAPNTTRYRDFVNDFEWVFTYGSDDVARITYFEGGVRTMQVIEDWSSGGNGKDWAVVVVSFDDAGDQVARNTIFDTGKQRLTTFADGERVSEVVTGDTFDPIRDVSFKESLFDDTGLVSRATLNDWGVLRLETLDAGAPLGATSYALQPSQGSTTWIEIETNYGPDGQITRKEVDYGGGFSRVTTIDGDRRTNLTVDEDPDGDGGAAGWKSYLFVEDDDFRFNFIDYDDGDQTAWFRDAAGLTEIAFDGDGDEDWLYEVVTSPNAGGSTRETYDRAEDVPTEQLALLDPTYVDQIA